LSLQERVLGRLKEATVPHALIGAGAMAARGVSRSTFDIDFLVIAEVEQTLPRLPAESRTLWSRIVSQRKS